MSTRPDPSAGGGANRELVRGSAWAVLLRWIVRSIGLVSIVILARLLEPEDMGLFAMAIIVIGLLDQMSDMGVSTHLIRAPEASRAHCDTAWTMQMLQALLIGALAAGLAPLAAGYFGEPRVVPVLQVLALSVLIDGVQNIGMVLVRRDLDFATDFRFDLYKRLVRFVATIAFAAVLGSYWALVAGQLATSVATVVLSYRMHPYRPRPGLAAASEYLRFGAHVLPIRLARYFSGRIGVLAVGRIASTAALGSFNVVSELANMVVQEIVIPVGRALLPSYSKFSDDREHLASAFVQMFAFLCMVCLPLGAGLAAVARDAVLVLLGEKWAAGIPLMPWLAAFATLKGMLFVVNGPILIVTKHERTALASALLEVALLAPAAFVAGARYGALGVAVAMALVEALLLPVAAVLLTRALPLSPWRLLRCAGRPIAAAAAMLCVLAAFDLGHDTAPLARLLVDVLAGAATYVAVSLLLWLAGGARAGPERSVLEACRRLAARRTGPGRGGVDPPGSVH